MKHKRTTLKSSNFFSYECIHCQRLEQRIQQFEEKLPENVSFSRIHVAFSVEMRRLAAMHIALELSDALDQNHDRIFQEAAKTNNTFRSLDSISDFLDGYGISKARFENLYQGRRVQALVDRNINASTEARIRGTPSLLVANKYVVHPDEPAPMMQTLQQLIKNIRAGKLPLPEEEVTPDVEEEVTPEVEEEVTPGVEEDNADLEAADEKPEAAMSNDDEAIPDPPTAEDESADDSPAESDSAE